MKIENMRIFIETLEQGSITKAAEVLYTSKQNLGFIIKNVEEETGRILLIRKKSGLELTEDGKEFVKYAKEIVRLYDRFLETSQDSQQKKETVFDFYTTPRLIMRMPEIQKILYKRGYQVSLHIVSNEQLLSLLNSGTKGLYVHISNENATLNRNTVKTKVIAEDESIVNICHKSNPILLSGSDMREEIEQGSLIAYSEDNIFMKKIVDNSGIEYKSVISVRDLETAKYLMKEHQYFFSAPYSFFRVDFDPSEYQILPFSTPITIKYCLTMVGELDINELQYGEILNNVMGAFRS